jgi:hypothetical protein
MVRRLLSLHPQLFSLSHARTYFSRAVSPNPALSLVAFRCPRWQSLYKNRLHGTTNESAGLCSQGGNTQRTSEALTIALCLCRTRKPKQRLLIFQKTRSAFIQTNPRPAYADASRLQYVLHQQRAFYELIPKQCCTQHVQDLEPISKEALSCTKTTLPSRRHASRVSFF